MPFARMMNRFRSGVYRAGYGLGPAFFDLVCLSFIGIWLKGGIGYGGHVYLKHGADSRRAAIISIILGYVWVQSLREHSFVLRAVRKGAEFLTIRRNRWSVYWFCCLGAAGLAVAQANAMRVTLWDVGIFHQILWSLAHGFGFTSTISGAGDFLKDHFAPSLALLVPLFRLFGESPLFLPIVQVLLLFGGGAAWIFLAERAVGAGNEKEARSSNVLAAATVVFILGFDSLWKNQRWGFHENAIAFCSLSWALALLMTPVWSGRLKLKNFVVFGLFLITAGAKEILLLNVAVGLGIWFFKDIVSALKSAKSRVPLFSGLKILIAISLVVGFVVFEKMAHPVGKNYFNRYYAYLGENLVDFLKNLVFSPALVLNAIGLKSILKYFAVVFLPWLFLIPLFININARGFKTALLGDAAWLLMIVPSFASAVLASYPPLRDPGFHYVLELWPVLACVTIQGLARQKSTSLVWGWAVLSLLVMDVDPLNEYREFHSQEVDRTDVVALIQKIPPEASVMADELAGTWVAGRRWVSRWPDNQFFPEGCPNFVLIDNSLNNRTSEVRDLILRCSGKAGMAAAYASLLDYQRAGDWVLLRVSSPIH